MGRLESLSAWALGRGYYEEELIRDPDAPLSGQQYNSRGHPRNPRTKEQEKDNVRAANEVMQTTGVVEDADVAKRKHLSAQYEKSRDTLTALNMMECGRIILTGGVWGVFGLRRRILLYRPYSEMSLLRILRHEVATQAMPSLIWSGLPTVVTYHAADWSAFFAETIVDAVIDEDEEPIAQQLHLFKLGLLSFFDFGFTFITLHFRLFSILQQLNLIPPSRLLPSLRSFIPFSAASPLQLPPLPSLQAKSIATFGLALLATAAPMLVIYVNGRAKNFISRLLYRPIYKCLPRPIGDSMFQGLGIMAPDLEYDTPDQPEEEDTPVTEDRATLRALEGTTAPPPSGQRRTSWRQEQPGASEDEDEDQPPTTLISFDVEATEPAGATESGWSAELRSAQEPTSSTGTKYRITGLTLLPFIMATEAMREVLAGLFCLPFEALMVRTIGRSYPASAGLGVDDMLEVTWGMMPKLSGQAWENLVSVTAMQVIVTGVVWAGVVSTAGYYAERQRATYAAEKAERDAEREGSKEETS